MSSHFLRSRALVCIVVAPEDEYRSNKCPPLFSFLLAVIVEQTSYAMEYPFGQFRSSGLAMSPPKILLTRLLGEGNAGGTALLSCNQNTGELPTSFQHSTMRAAIGKINSISADQIHTIFMLCCFLCFKSCKEKKDYGMKLRCIGTAIEPSHRSMYVSPSPDLALQTKRKAKEYFSMLHYFTVQSVATDFYL